MKIFDLGEKLPDPLDQITVTRSLFEFLSFDSLSDSLQHLLSHVDPRLEDLKRGVHRLILVVLDLIVRTLFKQ
nr:hypothetical protein CFP56_60058 [Quercus suber]